MTEEWCSTGAKPSVLQVVDHSAWRKSPKPPHIWLTRDDPEWDVAWSHFPDRVMAEPRTGECLQYMGSEQAAAGDWQHVFRHRAAPDTLQRRYWRIPASPGWPPPRA